MVNVRKPKSRKKTLAQKHKIERKVSEFNRKKRRAVRKAVAANGGKKFQARDPGVPNAHPQKAKILADLEAAEERDKEDTKKQQIANYNKNRQMEALAELAEAQNNEYSEKAIARAFEAMNALRPHIDQPVNQRAYFREMKKVIARSDVVLEVLDARDPLGSRSYAVEKMITADPQKKLVLVMNKIDLVPRPVVEGWLKYLRNECPTIAFKSSLQEQNKNLAQNTKSVFSATEGLLESKQSLGADVLIALLKNYSRSEGSSVKKSITVGVIGYPNVGKSSLINSLKRSRSAAVGSTPGLTKVMQEISLDKNLKLLDSPGVILSSNLTESDIILRNAVRIESIQDYITPVESILARCNKKQLMERYQLHDWKDTDEFLAIIARQRGKMRKGGVPNKRQAALTVLQDWTEGKIPFYTKPPQAKEGVHVGASVVQKFSEGIDLKVLADMDQTILRNLEPHDREFLEMEAGDASGDLLDPDAEVDVEAQDEKEDDEDEDDVMIEEQGDDDTPAPTPAVPSGKKGKAQADLLRTAEDSHNPRSGLALKKKLKAMKKKVRRANKATAVSTSDEAYDFARDFTHDDNDDNAEDEVLDDV